MHTGKQIIIESDLMWICLLDGGGGRRCLEFGTWKRMQTISLSIKRTTNWHDGLVRWNPLLFGLPAVCLCAIQRLKCLSHFECARMGNMPAISRARGSIFMFRYGVVTTMKRRLCGKYLNCKMCRYFSKRRASHSTFPTPVELASTFPPFNENISLRLRCFCHYRHFGLG